jgi:hypothetical protein
VSEAIVLEVPYTEMKLGFENNRSNMNEDNRKGYERKSETQVIPINEPKRRFPRVGSQGSEGLWLTRLSCKACVVFTWLWQGAKEIL